MGSLSAQAINARKLFLAKVKDFAKDNKGVIAELDDVGKLNDALADEILRKASAYFAQAELDCPFKR